MSNPKTTIAGYLVLLAAMATVAAHVLTGSVSLADFGAILPALTGIGLIAAKDGGH